MKTTVITFTDYDDEFSNCPDEVINVIPYTHEEMMSGHSPPWIDVDKIIYEGYGKTFLHHTEIKTLVDCSKPFLSEKPPEQIAREIIKEYSGVDYEFDDMTMAEHIDALYSRKNKKGRGE